jgi:mannose-6-phosphate isomerase-like protein (cupin superfamily)
MIEGADERRTNVAYSFSSIDELGEGPGFRKVRRALGVTAFGVNAIVYPPGQEGFLHYHEQQDELYFVHSGRGVFEVDGEQRELGPGGLCHVEAASRRKVTNPSDTEDLVMLVVGGKGGYVERDGMLVDPERDLPRRQAFGG